MIPERLAWSVLRTANRTQAKGSTARIVVPRDPEMVDELSRDLEVTPTDDDLLSAEEYLEERGYLAPTYIGLTRGTYTITPVGLRWIEWGPPGVSEAFQAAGEDSEDAKPRRSHASGENWEAPEPGTGVSENRPGGVRGSRRPSWWRRILGE
jgi:hypothetical protein